MKKRPSRGGGGSGLGGIMPGVIRLVEELGVGTKTAVGAMAALEREGVIESRGARRGSRIIGPGEGGARSLHVKILLFNKGTRPTETASC